MNLRKLAKVAIPALSLSLLGMGINTWDVEINQVTRRWPALHFQSQYNLPNTQEPEIVSPLPVVSMPNERSTLEERIAELLITTSKNLGKYTPGGVLLRKEDTRKGHLFGKHASYSASRTQSAVEDIRERALSAKQRILVYDEGEGGFVPRVGVLPTAEDIGNYFSDNVIGKTIEGKVLSLENKNQREYQIEKLFADYAGELKARGVNAVFGPVLDVPKEDSSDNLIKKDGRSFSDRHIEVRLIAVLYAQAMHREGIRVVGKHFLNVGLGGNGNVHTQQVPTSDNITQRRRAAHTYRVLKRDLDGVMVTHLGNYSDGNRSDEEDQRPYSISRRGLELLTKKHYPSRHKEPETFAKNRNVEVYDNNTGVNFGGLVVLDDLSMRGLLDYINTHELSEYGKKLTAGCKTDEAKAAVLALDAGAHTFIVFRADTTAIVEGLAYAANADKPFKRKVEYAISQYQQFAEARQ